MPSEIQQAILVLPKDEYARLREWLSDLDWERWDKQIEVDSESGQLDFLIGEAGETDTLGSIDGKCTAQCRRQRGAPAPV